MAAGNYALVDELLAPDCFRAFAESCLGLEDEVGMEGLRSGGEVHDAIAREVRRFARNPSLSMGSAYVVTTTPNICGAVHHDTIWPVSAVLHLVLEWTLAWGGEILLVAPDRETVQRAVEFRPNRLVIFDAKQDHLVRPPTQIAPQPRRALVTRWREA